MAIADRPTGPGVRVLAQDAAELAVAREIADLVRAEPACCLGLATGRTPVGIYAELARRHRSGLSFAGVTTFNLDEFLGLAPDDPRSFRATMREHLFSRVDLQPERARFPDPADPAAYDGEIERAGGIAFQLLGIGRNGHIAFNEPGAPAGSRTRAVELHPITRADAAPEFGSPDAVPTHAVTMGVATILAARRIRILAFGAKKAEIVQRALEGPVTPDVPASLLRRHPDVLWLLDEAAAARLAHSTRTSWTASTTT